MGGDAVLIGDIRALERAVLLGRLSEYGQNFLTVIVVVNGFLQLPSLLF
jgi:hypothetical protein